MRLEAITWDRLVDLLAERLLELETADGAPWARVALDGAPAARPGDLAERLAEALRARGRPSLVVGTDGFLRPASVRLEYGHQDLESYYGGWYDTGALWREVFDPLGPGGSGRVLPDLWDPATDRATRSPYVQLPPGGVLLLHGPLLLRHWFPFDLSVHLLLSTGALRRRTPRPSTGRSPPSSATRRRPTRPPRPTCWCGPTTPAVRPGAAETARAPLPDLGRRSRTWGPAAGPGTPVADLGRGPRSLRCGCRPPTTRRQ